MSKSKKELLVLAFLIFLGMGYGIYQYWMVPAQTAVEQKKKLLESDKVKLNSLKQESKSIDSLKAQNDKLKQQASELDNMTVKDIDTPQLVYDFYNFCKQYGVTGQDLTFQLNAANNGTGGAQNQQPQNSQTQNNQQPQNQNVQQPASQQGNLTQGQETLVKLTIDLKAVGDKNKIEKFVRNLGSITTRKLTVKSISLQASVSQSNASQNGAITGNTLNGTMPPNTGIVTPSNPTTTTQNQQQTDQVTADIVFYQYVMTDGKPVDRNGSYDFYNGVTGFSNFSDMFK